MKPKVQIISERPAVRESACVLVGTMRCSWVLASRIEDALTNFESEMAAAVVLDLPDEISDPGKIGRDFFELLDLVHGRLVILTHESAASETGDLEKKYSVPFVQRERLTADLWPCLDTLMFSQPGIRRITQVAHLVLDTFFQAVPAGIRSSQNNNLRQLVYEVEHFTADISMEHPPGSRLTAVFGQVMRDADPRIPLNGVAVVLRGEKGPIELKMTNQFGEFSFEFEDERKITLEIEVNPGHWVALASPNLEWDTAAAAGTA